MELEGPIPLIHQATYNASEPSISESTFLYEVRLHFSPFCCQFFMILAFLVCHTSDCHHWHYW